MNDSHFDAVVEDLGLTLKDMGVSDDLIAQVAAVAETTREAVLGRGASDTPAGDGLGVVGLHGERLLLQRCPG